MARGGVYKTEVQKARDSLLAQGVNPSLDAVRIALGNTGSKSTIHRYMKELEAEEGAGQGNVEPLSEALTHLVSQLAERLRLDAEERIGRIQATCDAAVAQAQAALTDQAKESRALSDQLQRTETLLREERGAHAITTESLQRTQTQVATLGERVTGLDAQLHDREVHIQSLEVKHQQAREALEHFRQSTREQREAELRRHEHQVQSLQVELRQAQELITVKNQDVLHLNRENARLTEQYAERDKSLRDLQRQYDQAAAVAKELPALKREAETVARHWAEANAELEQLRVELTRREANWEAERAVWQEERDERVKHDDRLQNIEEILATLKPLPSPTVTQETGSR